MILAKEKVVVAHKYPHIAIDGPSGAGKGSHAGRVAKHFGYRHLDTGSMYRAIALKVLDTGVTPLEAAKALTEEELTNPELRSERIDDFVHQISPIQEVRDEVNAFAQRLLDSPPGSVTEGRANAKEHRDVHVKIFIDADVEKRAEWRVKQNRARKKGETDYDKVLANLAERDHADRTRPNAPLGHVPDLYDAYIDATGLTEDEVFDKILEVCQKLLAAAA